MSDSSFEPSSEGPGTDWALSQAHQEIYDERKQQRRQERENKRRRTLSKSDPETPMKQESLSPCPTPRATAVKANELLAEYAVYTVNFLALNPHRQYAGALNSQMGENTYVDTYIYTSKESTPTREFPFNCQDSNSHLYPSEPRALTARG